MIESIIKDLVTDPTFIKRGGEWVIGLIFIYYIYNVIEKRIVTVINEKHNLIREQVKNIVHDEMDSVRSRIISENEKISQSSKEYHEHAIRNINLLKTMISEEAESHFIRIKNLNDNKSTINNKRQC